jgi:hypothetical protein
MTNVWPVHDEDDHMKEGSGQLLGRSGGVHALREQKYLIYICLDIKLTYSFRRLF